MAKKREVDLGLPSLDDLFSSQKTRDEAELSKIQEIPLSEIDDFPNHPFKVRDDEDMAALVESIRLNGVLTPAIVRQKEDGRYELISGHRRKRACMLAGLTKLRSEVINMDRDAATIFMVDSNLQRTTILPSEKAFSYKMRLEAMKRQSGRPRKNDVPVAQDLKGIPSRKLLGDEVGESQDNVRRYIRLTELIPGILDIVDTGEMGLRPAVEISYLPKDLQGVLLEVMEMEVCTPSHAQTIRMRNLLKQDKLTPEMIYSILQEEKPNQKERIVLRSDRIKNLIPKNLPVSQREEYIVAALQFYSRSKIKDRER